MSPPDAREAPDLGHLLARVVLRDQVAFKELYDRTVRALLAIIVRLLRDQSWAEEVLQEVYVSVWHSAPNYSASKAQPMTWLMTIARYKAMDALRSTTGERENIVRLTPTDEDDEAVLPDIADESAGPMD